MHRISFRGWYPDDAWGEIIKWWDNSDDVHISVVFENGDYPQEWESLPVKGVHGHAPDVLTDALGHKVDFDVTPEQFEKALAFAKSKEGCHYGYSTIVSFPLPFVERSKNAYICSEYAYLIARDAGIIAPLEDPVVTPDEIMKMLEQAAYDRLENA